MTANKNIAANENIEQHIKILIKIMTADENIEPQIKILLQIQKKKRNATAILIRLKREVVRAHNTEKELLRAMCPSRSARAAVSAIFTIMFCSFCGETCVAGAAFCHKCGKKISASEKDSSPGPSGIQ